MPELINLRHEWFCRHYVSLNCANATEAARRAGYTGNWIGDQASWLLKKKEIRHRIRELQNHALRKNNMDINRVLKNLEEFANREPQNDSGNDRNTIQANIELAKMLGAYTEKIQLNGGGSNGISLRDLDLPLDVQKLILERIRKAKDRKEAQAATLDDE